MTRRGRQSGTRLWFEVEVEVPLRPRQQVEPCQTVGTRLRALDFRKLEADGTSRRRFALKGFSSRPTQATGSVRVREGNGRTWRVSSLVSRALGRALRVRSGWRDVDSSGLCHAPVGDCRLQRSYKYRTGRSVRRTTTDLGVDSPAVDCSGLQWTQWRLPCSFCPPGLQLLAAQGCRVAQMLT